MFQNVFHSRNYLLKFLLEALSLDGVQFTAIRKKIWFPLFALVLEWSLFGLPCYSILHLSLAPFLRLCVLKKLSELYCIFVQF